MRHAASALLLVSTSTLAFWLTGCDGCGHERGPSAEERTAALASAIQAPPAASAESTDPGIGHAVNVIPGQGPKRVEFTEPRAGLPMPILPGQGIGPIRFGATRATIERLMGAPCEDASETLCRYVGRAVELRLLGGVLTEIRVSRKGREAKRAADGSIIEYGFFNGLLLPDLYFGMKPQAIQERLGPPTKVEQISPLGPDGFAERHYYDGVTLEYDRWSNGNLVLGAAILSKSDSAAAANEKVLNAMEQRSKEAAERGKKVDPNRTPR